MFCMQLIYATYLSSVSYEMYAKSACFQKDKLFPSTNKLIKKKKIKRGKRYTKRWSTGSKSVAAGTRELSTHRLTEQFPSSQCLEMLMTETNGTCFHRPAYPRYSWWHKETTLIGESHLLLLGYFLQTKTLKKSLWSY